MYPEPVLERARQIRLLIFDVDGVLTDGRLYFSDDGQETKAFHSRDGLGMTSLRDLGLSLAIITGRRSDAVAHRMNNLGITHVYQGQRDKLEALNDLMQKLNLDAAQIAYVGDDWIDLPVMREVGLAVAVNDAVPEVRATAHWCTKANGGNGAAREVCNLIIQAQGLTPHWLQ